MSNGMNRFTLILLFIHASSCKRGFAFWNRFVTDGRKLPGIRRYEEKDSEPHTDGPEMGSWLQKMTSKVPAMSIGTTTDLGLSLFQE